MPTRFERPGSVHLRLSIAGAGIGAVVGLPRGPIGALVGLAIGAIGAQALLVAAVLAVWLLGRIRSRRVEESSRDERPPPQAESRD